VLATILKLIELLSKLPFRAIATLLKTIIVRRQLVVIICLLLAIFGITSLVWYYHRSRTYSDLVNTTLHAQLEKTPQQYKGLEAFMMSKVNRAAVETLKTSPLSDSFVCQYQRLTSTILDIKYNDKDNSEQHKKCNTTQNISATDAYEPRLRTTGGSNGRVLTDIGFPGFLFAPLDIIRGGSSYFQADQEALIQHANELLQKDTSLKNDVIMSRVTANILKEMLANDLVDNSTLDQDLERRPAQVYLVTSNGINRIFSNKIPDGLDADAYYGTQFSPATFFPSRPYFQGALDPHLHLRDSLAVSNGNSQNQQTVGDYFYVSQPYMDLAGNGIVITVSRRLETYDNSIAVLCLDFTYVPDKNLSKTLTRTLKELNAATALVHFNIDSETRYPVDNPKAEERTGHRTMC
jgi:hypothetical protein